jgi:hypothetical protein
MPGLLSYLPKKTDERKEETSSSSASSSKYSLSHHRIDTGHTISTTLSNAVDDSLQSSEIARPTLEQLKSLMM